MLERLAAKNPRKGLLRFLLRFPIYLYQFHLGWVLGDRFLLLKHGGRKSGLLRKTVLEVVRHDKETDTYIVASGWGEKSEWFRNIRREPAVRIEVGCREIRAWASQLSKQEAEMEMRDYARRHPYAFRTLATIMLGQKVTGNDERMALLAKNIPLVALLRQRMRTT